MPRLHKRLHLGGHGKEPFVKVACQGNLKPCLECRGDQSGAMFGRSPGGGLGKVLPEVFKDPARGVGIGQVCKDVLHDALPPLPLAVATGGMRGAGGCIHSLLPLPGRTEATGQFANRHFENAEETMLVEIIDRLQEQLEGGLI